MKNAHEQNESIHYAALAMITVINGLFCYKYSLRVTEFALPLTVVYCSVVFALPFIVGRIPTRFMPFSAPLMLVVLFMVAAITYLAVTDPARLRVDRWSVIASFWDALLDGSFPYSARSHLGHVPGPLPFYFVIAFPFYLVGEIGYSAVVGVLTLVYIVWTRYPDRHNRLVLILMLVTSAPVLWEIASRSTVLLNAVLAFVYIDWVARFGRHSKRHAVAGLIGGLLLSTRFVMVIPILVCYVYCFLRDKRWNQFIVAGASCAAGFLLTLLPFALWDYQLFVQYNPLFLQSDFLPLPFAVVLAAISVAVGFFIRSGHSLWLSIGVLLAVAATGYLMNLASSFGWWAAYVGSTADISYFVLAFPFLLASLFVLPDDGVPVP